MAAIKLSTTGRLTIPKDVRKRHGWDATTNLVVEDIGHAVVIRPLVLVKPTTLEDVVGCLRHLGKPKTLAEMDRAIE